MIFRLETNDGNKIKISDTPIQRGYVAPFPKKSIYDLIEVEEPTGKNFIFYLNRRKPCEMA